MVKIFQYYVKFKLTTGQSYVKLYINFSFTSLWLTGWSEYNGSLAWVFLRLLARMTLQKE